MTIATASRLVTIVREHEFGEGHMHWDVLRLQVVVPTLTQAGLAQSESLEHPQDEPLQTPPHCVGAVQSTQSEP